MTAKTIINKLWFYMQTVFCILIAIGIATWDGTDTGYNICFILIGAVLFIGYALLEPNRVRFDEHGITVHYMFGLKTYAEWKELKAVGVSVPFARFPWQECYEIGYFKSRIIFHREACIPKNKKKRACLKSIIRERSVDNSAVLNAENILAPPEGASPSAPAPATAGSTATRRSPNLHQNPTETDIMTAKTIINKNWYILQAMNSPVLAFGIICAVLWDGTGKWYAFGIILFSVILITYYALLVPNRVRFDEQGITVHYMFGIKTYAEWKALKAVGVSLRGQIFPWQKSYEIGHFKSRNIFHRDACIPKNKKTTRMIEEYYQKSVR